jgi:perosamine synthetase
MIRIGRTLPPAAAPISLRDIWNGLKGLLRGQAEIKRFESELRDYFKVQYCFLVSSGTASLTLILRALHDLFPERDEVIIPAFTCYSVPSAIVRARLRIRLCDVDPDTLDFNFDRLSTLFSSTRLLAIIPTHLFALPADIERVRQLVKSPEVTIIEDAAQAMGGKKNDRLMGTLGDVSFFSLGRGKALSTVEGGIILTSRENIAKKISGLMEALPGYGPLGLITLWFKSLALSLFLRPSLFWLPKALPFLKLGETLFNPNFKMRTMSGFQAGLTREWHGKLKHGLKVRSELTMKWSSITHAVSSQNGLHTQAPRILSKVGEDGINGVPNLLRFPMRINDTRLRHEILKESQRTGLGMMHAYPDSVNGIKEVKAQFLNQEFPAAKTCARNIVTLPTHHFVTRQDIQRITELILRHSKDHLFNVST